MINRLKFNRRSLFRGLLAAPAIAAAGTEIAKPLVVGQAQKRTGISFPTTCYMGASNVYLNYITVSLSPDCTVSISKETDFTVSPGKIVLGKLLG